MTDEAALRTFLSEYSDYERICRDYCLQSHRENDPWRPEDTRNGNIPRNVWFTTSLPIFLVRHERYTYTACHAHVQLEIMYMFDGCCTQTIEGESVTLRQGDICMVAVGAQHQPQIFDDSILVNILVEMSLLESLCAGLNGLSGTLAQFVQDIRFAKRYPAYLLCRPGSDAALRSLFVLLISEFYDNRPHAETVVQSLLSSILTVLGRDFDERTRVSETGIAGDSISIQILQYMRNNACSLTLGQLSDRFHYSKQHICRLVRDATGLRFGEYLRMQRLREVKRLLRESDQTVKEIAEHCGYAENTYFHRMFKAQTGMTPLEFRAASKKIPQP